MSSRNESIPPSKISVVTNGASAVGRTPTIPVIYQSPMEITLRPTEAQEKAGEGVSEEIGQSPTFGDDFGKHAPTAAVVASAFSDAMRWSEEAKRSEEWAKFCKVQSDRTWQVALGVAGQFKSHFDHAREHDPNIALRYPKTARFYGVREDAAARAAVTRKKNRAAKKNNTPPA